MINKQVTIIDKEHIEYLNWGIIINFDGEYYHVAMNNGSLVLVFTRDQFRVKRSK